jgi:hypothetical protein
LHVELDTRLCRFCNVPELCGLGYAAEGVGATLAR